MSRFPSNNSHKTWQKLGLRLGPTARLYAHDESSVSFNYRVEHTDLELPGPVSTNSLTPELESVRCHLNFSVQIPGFPSDVQNRGTRRRPPKNGKKRKHGGSARTLAHGRGSSRAGSRMIVSFARSNSNGLTAKREESATRDFAPRIVAIATREITPGVTVKRERSPADAATRRSAIHESGDITAGMGVSMVSDHPELETIVRAALDHMLLGSRPRGARVSGGFVGKALAKVAPAVFDTDRLRVPPPLPPVPVKTLLTPPRESLPGCL